jgi:predicted nuclease of predicted toxin-antitoxin system
VKFLANMGLSTRTTAWLRQQGHDAVHLHDEGMQRAADEVILIKARAEGRVVLTMDLDFGYLLAISGAQLPSVVLFRLDDESAEVVNQRLAEVLEQCTTDLEVGAIISVSETAIRVRRLPI